MKLLEKLQILADSAKYDASCASSGSNRGRRQGMLGSATPAGICHSWADDGRCISLLKVLFSNACVYDCAYCSSRVTNDIPRASFTPDELAELTIGFYRRNYIEGLFLSSAVLVSPDHTMELMVRAVRKLREVYRFNGYIHMKAIPGADPRLIHEAGLLCDRISVNIELPSESGLRSLAPQKEVVGILRPMGYLRDRIAEANELLPVLRHAPAFAPAGQSTQLIVGATADSDFRILKLSERMYRDFRLKRVYYSAYIPVNAAPGLPALYTAPPLLREHRMYQADWLLRFYGFSADELLDEGRSGFDTRVDPKADWAIRHLDRFPIEVNTADYEELLRVPGIGVLSAKRIMAARRLGPLTHDDLAAMRIVLRRAQYFITCGGRFRAAADPDSADLVAALADKPADDLPFEQLSMFQMPQEAGAQAQGLSAASGLQSADGLAGATEQAVRPDIWTTGDPLPEAVARRLAGNADASRIAESGASWNPARRQLPIVAGDPFGSGMPFPSGEPFGAGLPFVPGDPSTAGMPTGMPSGAGRRSEAGMPLPVPGFPQWERIVGSLAGAG